MKQRSKVKYDPLSTLLITNQKLLDSSILKKRMVDEGYFKYKCAMCELDSWLGKKLVLRLDHINGDITNYTKENLRLLCHNCDSLTDFYCGKNNKKKRKQKPICECGKEMYWGSVMCNECSRKLPHSGRRQTCWKTKIDWPSIEELVRRVKESSYTHVGRELGVSDVAVHMRLEKEGIRSLKGYIRGERGATKPRTPRLTIWEYMVKTHGIEKATEMNRVAGKKSWSIRRELNSHSLV